MTQPEPARPLGQLLDVETRFHSEATRAGGVKRSAVVRQVTQMMEAAQPELQARLGQSMSKLGELASDLELSDAHDVETIRDLRGQVRKLRDFGALADFPMVSAIAAMLADVLSQIVGGRLRYRADVVRCFVDALDLFSSEDKRGISTLEQPQLLADLGRMQHLFMPAKK